MKKYKTNRIFWLLGKQVNLAMLEYNDLYWLRALLVALYNNAKFPVPKLGEYTLEEYLDDIDIQLQELKVTN